MTSEQTTVPATTEPTTAACGATATTNVPAPARPTRPKRVPQIDAMRLLICVSVVATHTVFNSNPHEAVASNAVVNLLHYTRQAFFFISALVLVRMHWSDVQPDGRVRGSRGQMRRRMSVLGIPYLVWSTLYMVQGVLTAYSWWAVVHLPWFWFSGLIQGTDGYQMYFLLVSVMFAMVFPLFLRLLWVSRNHHVVLLVVSGAIEVATMAFFHYVYQPDFWWRPVVGEASLFAYQFWLVAGGVAALHFDAIHAWVLRHARAVVWSMIGICAIATGLFFANVAGGETAEFAGRSMQPVTVPLSIAAIGAFYLWSVWIVRIDRPWSRRLVESGIYLSFGIYLVHPMILTFLLIYQAKLPGGMAYHPVITTTVITVLDFVLSFAAAWVLSYLPFSRALIGRSRRRRGATLPLERSADRTPAAQASVVAPVPSAAKPSRDPTVTAEPLPEPTYR